MKKIILFIISIIWGNIIFASYILIPMDESQSNHLKAYGITYWTLQQGVESQWLLNYRGGSFIFSYVKEVENECIIRGVSYEVIPDTKANAIFSEIAQPEVNMDAVKLEKVPRICVYSPKNALPWDDAVTLALNYAEIPYDIVYDEEIINGALDNYEWLHLHHEDFTGQYGKFWYGQQNTAWYRESVRLQEETAKKFGFKKVSQLKLFVANKIKNFVFKGGFMFAMCAATDSFDISLAAENTDICSAPFDGDPIAPDAPKKLDYLETFAFTDFIIEQSPYVYEFSDIDVSQTRQVQENNDVFTLFDFSAKWDPIPSMLCQNHTNVIDGFLGQTTAFNKSKIKTNVLIMGENKALKEARYIHGEFGQGMWTFYGGHDPEDYQHLVYDEKTDLALHPNSPGYRLILNNVLFPSAKKKKLKT